MVTLLFFLSGEQGAKENYIYTFLLSERSYNIMYTEYSKIFYTSFCYHVN